MLLLGPFIWGFALLLSMNATYRKMKTPKLLHVSDIRTFESILASSSPPKLSRLRVAGNFSKIADDHPVVEAVLSRWKANSKPGQRAYGDVNKIALSIEGGGMRGCVSAGATAALNILGIHDTIDVVYGSSAGAMIGAYFISRQFSGVQIYHDILPSAGSRFIDKGKLLFAAGLPGWLNFFLRRQSGTIDEIMSFIPDPEALGSRLSSKKSGNQNSLTNVINLDFLLVQVMGILQPLDWNIFTKNEASQPLKIVASSLKTMAPVVMSREKGNYGDLSSLLQCIRASMAVPGITGGMMAISESERTSLPSTGHSCSVPFNVQKRSKENHLYEVAKNGIDEVIPQIPQKSVKLTGIMGTKIVQEAIVVARAAIVVLLRWITLMRGNADTREALEMNNNYVASEIYGERSVGGERGVGVERGVGGVTPVSIERSIGRENTKYNKNTQEERRSIEDCEPLVDAFLCEPLPYRSAVLDGASHVIVLRTRPDPCPVLGKGPGVFEKLIAKRFFTGYKEEGASEWMMDLNHHRVYAEDVLRLSEGSRGPKEGVNVDGIFAHLLSIAPGAGRVEVGQLETRRDKVLKGMQDGARRVFEIFGPSILGVSEESEIEELVQSVFPDEMLKRVVSLAEFERTLVIQDGIDNQS